MSVKTNSFMETARPGKTGDASSFQALNFTLRFSIL